MQNAIHLFPFEQRLKLDTIDNGNRWDEVQLPCYRTVCLYYTLRGV